MGCSRPSNCNSFTFLARPFLASTHHGGFYVNSEQNMSQFRQILWLGPLLCDISLFLFRILFHVLIGFELADRENYREIIRGGKAAGVEIGFKIEKKAE